MAPVRKVSIYDLDVFYGLTNRFSLDLTIPYVTGSGGFTQGTKPNQRFVEWHANGIGDMTLQAEFWLNDTTKPSRLKGSVDLGIKAPTGSDSVEGLYLTPTGGEVQMPIDEAAQPGNGGWELIFRAQGQLELGGPFVAYASGYYGLSLTEHTSVHQTNPGGTVGPLRSVPDTYSGRLGAGYLLPFADGLFLSVGGRINGVTVKDVIGGGDLYWRRPGYEVYVEPGLSWTLGANIASVSVPLRVYQNKLDSPLDQSLHRHVGSDFAPYLVVASYARRF